jgi:hypothetical protein
MHKYYLVEGSEEKRPPGRPRRKREDTIKMDLRGKIERHKLDSCGSGWGTLKGSSRNVNEPSISTKFCEILE